MTCDEIQSLLLQSDDFSAPDGVFGRVDSHVAGCAACAELVRKLRRLNDAVRSLPDPSNLTASRLRFERRYATELGKAPRRLGAIRWVAAAAVVLAAAGSIGAYLHHQTENRAVASSEAIDRAVDFNLNLSRSESDADSRKLFAERAAALTGKDASDLATDAREFAEGLVRDAKFFTDRHDPLEKADHFTEVADQIVTRMDTTARKSPKQLARLGQDYFNVMNQGVHANLDLAASNSMSSAEYRRRLEKTIQRTEQMQAKLRATLRNHPEQSQTRKDLDQLERRLARLKQKAVAATQPGALVPKVNPIR